MADSHAKSAQDSSGDVFWVYYGCDEDARRQIQAHWQRLQQLLESKLAELSEPLTGLRIAVERGDDAPQWRIDGVLHTSRRACLVQSDDPSIESALDKLVHELASQLGAGDHRGPQVRRRMGLESLVPLLSAWREQGRSEAFLSFLAPVVASLQPYVRRELKLRESEGTLLTDQVAVFDVCDEVLIRAWDRLPDRDASLPLDLWLVQLADTAAASGQLRRNYLDEPAPEALSDRAPTVTRRDRQD